MEKKTLEILAGLALIILLSGPTSIYALGYFDSDGDGVIDNQDPFPHDPLKSKDSDGDGVGDTADAFPYDPNEQYDSDDDGVGNNEDEFPHNPRESKDSDGDGAGDNTDVFPNDPAASKDSDHDGYPDEWNEGWNQSDSTTNLTVDAFPYDPDEQYDSDGDGVGDTADAFPHNPNNWRDPSALPSEVIFDRDIQLSEISVGKGITYGGTYYYILDYSAEDNDARRVYQFDSNFSFTGLAWDYANYIENPTGIVYHDGHIYITGNKYDLLHGLQAYICKFSTTGEYQNSTSISSYVDFIIHLISSFMKRATGVILMINRLTCTIYICMTLTELIRIGVNNSIKKALYLLKILLLLYLEIKYLSINCFRPKTKI